MQKHKIPRNHSKTKQNKEIYSEFESLTVLGACQVMHKICSDYSHNMEEFRLVRNKDNATIKLAKECSPNDFYNVEESHCISTRGNSKYI